MNWVLQDYNVSYANIEPQPQKPETFSEMERLSKILSAGFYFVRVDFYSLNNRILFGEMTFTPQGGHGRWNNEEQNLKYGELLQIPNDN